MTGTAYVIEMLGATLAQRDSELAEMRARVEELSSRLATSSEEPARLRDDA